MRPQYAINVFYFIAVIALTRNIT